MKVKYRLFHTSGRVEKLTAEFRRKGDAGRLADTRMVFDRHVPGAHMEHVTVWFDEAYTDMFVDEEGKLKGLPFNEAATLVYWENTKVHMPEQFVVAMRSGNIDVICGDAILFEARIWE